MMSDRVVIAGIFLFGFAMENFFLMACAVICVTLGVVQSLIRMRNITRFYALDEDLKRISEADPKGRKGGGGMSEQTTVGATARPNLDEIRTLADVERLLGRVSDTPGLRPADIRVGLRVLRPGGLRVCRHFTAKRRICAVFLSDSKQSSRKSKNTYEKYTHHTSVVL